MKTCGAEKGMKWDFPFNSDMKPVVVVLTGVDLDATYVISVATVDQQQCGPPQSLSATLQLGGKQLLSPGCWFDSLFFFVWRLHVVLMCRCVSLPQSKDQFTLTIHSKFTTGVNVCVNGCRSLSVALCWWRTDQGVTPDRLDPMARWVRFQIPHQL